MSVQRLEFEQNHQECMVAIFLEQASFIIIIYKIGKTNSFVLINLQFDVF